MDTFSHTLANLVPFRKWLNACSVLFVIFILVDYSYADFYGL